MMMRMTSKLPLGTAWDGGSLLATLTSDHQLLCFEPPRSRQSLFWRLRGSITEVLLRHLRGTAFKDDRTPKVRTVMEIKFIS